MLEFITVLICLMLENFAKKPHKELSIQISFKDLALNVFSFLAAARDFNVTKEKKNNVYCYSLLVRVSVLFMHRCDDEFWLAKNCAGVSTTLQHHAWNSNLCLRQRLIKIFTRVKYNCIHRNRKHQIKI